jgi:hypothetical protein
MRSTGFIGSTLLAVGLLAGCGGVESTVDGQPSLETREDSLPACGWQQYLITYYAEPEHLTWVGEIVCECGSSGSTLQGRQSSYPVRVNGALCGPP